MPGTRKLGRPTDHRRAMLRGMVTYLLENGRVETTVTRAKEVRAMTEKMITIAKDNTLHARRQVLAYVTIEDVVKKLFDEIAPKYKDVNGGYTRIIKTGARRGDAAEMAVIELVEPKAEEKKPAKKTTAAKAAKKTTSTKKAAPKAEEKAEEVKEEATAAVEEAVEEAPAAVEEAVEEAAAETAEAVEEVVEEAPAAAEEAAEEAAEAVEETVEAAAEETAE